MPELPEVESVVRYLRPYVTGKSISKLLHHNEYSNVFSSHSPEDISQIVSGQIIQKMWRRGKYIIFTLGGGYVFVHLRMTGHLTTSVKFKDRKYITAEMVFSDRSSLYFKDFRKFGRFGYSDNIKHVNQLVGVEPLSSVFSFPYLQKELNKRKRQIKPLLLNQGFICGLGNIYVDECLWMARIHPKTISNNLPKKNIEVLYSSIISVLNEAISLKGTTIINFNYAANRGGEFGQHLNVYGRAGQPCYRCKKTIKKIFVGQRGTCFCVNCQGG